MDWRDLREQCLALPGAVEEFPFGDEVSVFKVGGKMFALSHLDGEPLQVSVKCDPELAVQLRAAYPAIAPGYHLNKAAYGTGGPLLPQSLSSWTVTRGKERGVRMRERELVPPVWSSRLRSGFRFDASERSRLLRPRAWALPSSWVALPLMAGVLAGVLAHDDSRALVAGLVWPLMQLTGARP